MSFCNCTRPTLLRIRRIGMTDRESQEHLSAAVGRDDLTSVRKALAQGADANSQDIQDYRVYVMYFLFSVNCMYLSQLFSFCLFQKRTVLMTACVGGLKSICEVLLENKADVSLTDTVSRDCGDTL